MRCIVVAVGVFTSTLAIVMHHRSFVSSQNVTLRRLFALVVYNLFCTRTLGAMILYVAMRLSNYIATLGTFRAVNWEHNTQQ